MGRGALGRWICWLLGGWLRAYTWQRGGYGASLRGEGRLMYPDSMKRADGVRVYRLWPRVDSQQRQVANHVAKEGRRPLRARTPPCAVPDSYNM